MSNAVESDVGIGLGMVFGVLALFGAAAMVAGPTRLTVAWGFAAATAAAGVGVVALHLFE